MKPLILALLIASPAVAQQCGPSTVVKERLQTRFGEQSVGRGLRNAQAIFEVWANRESGTWTIILTMPNGTSCVMAAGTDWQDSISEPQGVEG